LRGRFGRGVLGGVEEAHLDVDVHGAARVPAGIDRLELHAAVGVGDLVAAAVVLPDGARVAHAGLHARVGAGPVGVPDVDLRADERCAGAVVVGLHGQRERERQAGARVGAGDVVAVAGDVAAIEVEIDPVGALGDVGVEDAGAAGRGGRAA